MALAEHGSTPAVVRRAYGTGTTATTASFTPPVGAWLYVMVVVGWGSNPSGTPTLTATDSQSGTWTAGPTSRGAASQVAIFSRRVTTSAAMTITVTSSSSTSKSMMLSARVITGAAISQTGAATLSSTTSMTASITTTAAGSGVYLAGGAGNNATMTPTGSTTSLDAWADGTSGDDLAVGRMTNLTVTPGAVSLGWSPAGRVVGVEILPAPASYPAISTLVSDFTTTPAFLTAGSGTASVTGGQLSLPVTSPYTWTGTDVAYSLVGSSVYFKITPGHPRTGTYETLVFIALFGTGNYVTMYVSGTTFQGSVRTAGSPVFVTLAGDVYDPVAHAWWRVREASGTVFFDTSPDGSTWTNRGSLSHALDLSAVSLEFDSGYYGTESAVSPTLVDNLNTLPASNYTQTVTDAAAAGDTPTSASTAAQTVADQVLAADTATRATTHAPSVVDAAGAADTQTSVRGLSAGAVDAADAADSSAPVVDYQRFWVEPADVGDTATRAGDYARTVIDAVDVADDPGQGQDVAATVIDAVDVVDETDFIAGEFLDFGDTIGASDATEAVSEYTPVLIDPAGATDSLASDANFEQELVETVGVTDSAAALIIRLGSATDAIGVSDQIAVVVSAAPVITDAAGVADTVTRTAPAARQITTAVPTVDSVDVTARGRVTTPADEAVATDEAVVLTLSVSMAVPVAIETDTALDAQRAAQLSAPEAAGTDTVFTPQPTGSYPTEQAGDWELTFTPIVLVDDGEFAVAINDEDRTPTYVLKADWNRNGLYDHPLSDLTSLVEEVSVSRALAGTLPVEVGLVEGYSSAELSVTLVGEIPADAFEALDDRRNLIVNPSFETNTNGWTSNGVHSGGNMAREQAPFAPPSGSWYAFTQRNATGDLTIYPAALSVVVPGQRYTGSLYVNRDGSNDVRLDLDWYNSAGTFLTSTFGALNNPPTGTWTRLITSETAPAGATRARIFVRFINQALNFYVRLDAAVLEQSSSTAVGRYFDGSSAGAIWEGAAHNSTSLLRGAAQAPRVSAREFDVVDAFAPYRPDSPLYGRAVLQTPIYLETGFLADDGPRTVRRFTGTVTRIHPASAARTVELTAIDPVGRLRTPLTLSGTAMYKAIMDARGRDAYRSRINSQWLIDFALRRNGFFTSPPPRSDAMLSVTGHGSMIPEVGWGGAPEEYYSTYRGNMWITSRFGGALATVGGPIGRWWLTGQLTAATGSGFGWSMWMSMWAADGVDRRIFVTDLTFDQSWFINFGVDVNGKPYVDASSSAGAHRATATGFTPPSTTTWRFVGVHVSFSATAMTAVFRINGVTYTATTTTGSRGSNWSPNAYISYNFSARTFTNFQMWRSAIAPTAPWQGEDPNWVPQADLDPGSNELTGIPALSAEDAWELIKQVTDAEGSRFGFNEQGRPQFRSLAGDRAYNRTPKVLDPITADRNLADLVSVTDETTIRNVINIKTKTQLIGDWQPYFQATTVDQFDTPPGTSVFDIPIDSNVYDIPESRDAFGTNMGLGSLDRASFVFYIAEEPWNDSEKVPAIKAHIRVGIVYANNPVEITDPINNVPAVYIRVERLNANFMRIYITNYSAQTVRFATPSVAQDGVLRDGQPALIIPARVLEQGPEMIETYTDNTSASLYGPSSFDVGGSDDRWRQTPEGFRPLATEVLRNTASPVPVLDAVDVPHDPRRTLGSQVSLRDPDGLGEVTTGVVGLTSTHSTSGTRDQVTVRPIAPPS